MVSHACRLVETKGEYRRQAGGVAGTASEGRIAVAAEILCQAECPHFPQRSVGRRHRRRSGAEGPSPAVGAGINRDETSRAEISFSADLARKPVTAIELASVRTGDGFRGACVQCCLGCCALSEDPSRTAVFKVTPQLMHGIVILAEELIRNGIHLFSRERLNLCSASNELDPSRLHDHSQGIIGFSANELRRGAGTNYLEYCVTCLALGELSHKLIAGNDQAGALEPGLHFA